MSRWVIDASLTLQWYLEDEKDREYCLVVLAGLRDNEAIVPFLWTYEVANALVVAHRRARLSSEKMNEILGNLGGLPIMIVRPEPGMNAGLASFVTAA